MAQSPLNSELAPLHRLLRKVGHKRRRLRLMIGLFGILAGLAFVTITLFVLDWLLELTSPQRVVVFAFAGVLALLASRRWVLPWFARLESELDLALLVQKHFGIDSDLVAALQFERPEAAEWGSVELEQTVIRQVASQAAQLPLIEDVPRAPLKKRILATVCGMALIAGLVVLFPEHATVFTKRLLLHNIDYPRATRIVEVSVNGQPIAWDKPDQEVKCGAGGIVEIEVVAGGKIPKAGQALLRTLDGRRDLKIPLAPAEDRLNQAASSSQKAFLGRLNGLDRPCRFRFTLGDATSQWVSLTLVPPPVVLPWIAYQDNLSRHAEPEVIFGKTQVSLRQGARVVVGLASQSKLMPVVAKMGGTETALQQGMPELVKARLSESLFTEISVQNGGVLEKEGGKRLPLDIWWLDPVNTPLEKLEYPVRISFTIRDQFGLEPSVPVEIFVAVRPDYPPQLEARAIARLVLPLAQPSLYVHARDDVGLRELRVLGKVIQQDGEEGTTCQWSLWHSQGELVRVVDEKYKVDLRQLQTKKGDKIELVVVAEDERGTDQPGVATQSDPILMEVTDLAGILAVMAEADRESAAQLQEMINHQLDVGGGQ
ncbi:MAG: hypothetical protein ACUVQR_12045 [Thermogutta sp.]